jgi:hypothetical protein
MDSAKVRYAGLLMDVPEGWLDISDDLPPGGPYTLAKADGQGAIQISAYLYKDGECPRIEVHTLLEMCAHHCRSAKLNITPEVVADSRTICVGGTSKENEIVGFWYLTDKENIAMITYTGPLDGNGPPELADAERFVRSVEFPSQSDYRRRLKKPHPLSRSGDFDEATD